VTLKHWPEANWQSFIFGNLEKCFHTSQTSASRQKSGRGAPSREEAAQARSLDARRILSIWERRPGSFQGLAACGEQGV